MRIWVRNRMTLMATTAAIALAAAVLAAPAGAATSGQIGEAWGTSGSGAGQLVSPGMFGVDPSDGSVYTGEEKDSQHYRIQKFTAGGEFKAKVEIPRTVIEGSEEKVFTLTGMAVDPTLHRLYVIEGCHLQKPAGSCKEFASAYGAKRILVFSTEPSGTTLVPASPATLPLPSGEEALYEPQTIAVDPSNHELVILGENTESHTTVQRISSAGVAGARFVDTANELRPSGGGEATSLAVGPDGTSYMLTGAPGSPGAERTRAWKLPQDLSHAEKVPGFAEAAESEGWATGLLSPKNASFLGGPQIAISPDGSTLYWKESIELPEGDGEPGNVLIRGYSLTENATKVLYGNGSNVKNRCLIQTPEAGIATSGESLVVFDYGPTGESPSFGDRVMTFGSGGSDCRAPVAKFTVNGGSEEEVTVGKGVQVSFDASGSELLGGVPSEFDWNFGDGTEEKVKGAPAVATVKHTFTSAGTYKVTLRMKLAEGENAVIGNPLPITRTVKVTGGGTLFKLTVSRTGTGSGAVTSSPAGVECGGDCDQEYESGKEVTLTATAATGSKFTGWSGSCSGTGTCTVTMSEAKAVSAGFAPLSKFKLTVSKTGTGSGAVTSSPSGIDCRGDCEQEFEEGKMVTLVAHPATNSKFTGWSGSGCSGTGNCKVTMSEAKAVSASFDLKGSTFTLKVMKTGTGTGIVSTIPSGILCGGGCAEAEHDFPANSEVELLQEPTGSSTFVKWGGACSGTGTCKVTMSEAKTVTVEFGGGDKPEFKLKVTKTGTGTGTVTSLAPNTGIDCGSTCEAEFEEGKEVELAEAEDPGSEFVKWGGACSGSGACKVKMTAAKTVTAEFKSTGKPEFKLKVTKTGTGTVTSLAPNTGIDCGSTCEAEFEEGKEVELVQSAGSGFEFAEWTGACSGSGACKVKMTAAKTVGAKFNPKPAEEKEDESPPSTPAPTPLPAPAPTPAPAPAPKTAKQKALAKCKKLKGKARAKCVKKANSIGKHKRSKRHPLRGGG